MEQLTSTSLPEYIQQEPETDRPIRHKLKSHATNSLSSPHQELSSKATVTLKRAVSKLHVRNGMKYDDGRFAQERLVGSQHDACKYKAYLTVCLFAFLATANAIKFTIAAPQLDHEFHTTALEIKILTAFNVLALGVGNLLWVPLNRITGKRPIFLLALPILVAANVWSSQTHHYEQLLAASVLSGFGSSAAAGPVPAVVADLFYVHDGLFLGSLVDAPVVQYFSWRMNCYWIAIAAGVIWLLAIYTVQETSYYDRYIFKPIHGHGAKKNHR
ncbi:MFS general substrate transporter [Acephala macrosclerotiorum]|nr:MFS general substrate transporter [Acephala macrosclerotiorum]